MLKVSRATGSLALEASARNIAANVYSAAGVLTTLVAIRFTGLTILDPIVALGVALFILKATYDVRLPQAEENEIISCIMEHSGQLVGVHEVRTRKAGSASSTFILCSLRMPVSKKLTRCVTIWNRI